MSTDLTKDLHKSRWIDLYGSHRNDEFKSLKDYLIKSHVFRNGQYNIGENTAKDFYNPISDFSLAKYTQIPTEKPPIADTCLESHFTFDDGVENDARYKKSVTNNDFGKHESKRPYVFQADNTINWSDMSPKYVNMDQVKSSEYSANFDENQIFNEWKRPKFPKINTCKVKLPILTSDSVNNVTFGTDDTSYETETGRAFSQIARYGRRAVGDESRELLTKMKQYELSSSVFRDGDYNDKGSNDVSSTFMRDFGRPSNSETNIAINRNVQKAKLIKAAKSNSDTSIYDVNYPLDADENESEEKDKENDDEVPGLIRYSLQNKEEKTPENQDHTVAHIKLGNEVKTPASIYTNDFYPSFKEKQFIQPPPKDSQVLQRDFPVNADNTSVYTQHHSLQGLNLRKLTDSRQTVDENKLSRHAVSVALTLDAQKYIKDRQKSLSQDVYRKPPASFRPLPPQRAPLSKYNSLTSDGVYSRKHNRKLSSENQNNYVGAFMDPSISRTGRRQCSERRTDARSTHFILGYDLNPDSRFRTEADENFCGEHDVSDASSRPAAGKIEEIAPFRFEHFGISVNINDAGGTHGRSLMRSDYGPLEKRRYTDSQLLVMAQNAKIEKQKIESSHLFHTDNSGLNNYISMSMVDYLPPICSDTGRKFNMIHVQ